MSIIGELLGINDRDRDWTADALCAQVDADLFFPEKGGDARSPQRVCQACPVMAECLEYALQNSERFGVWGGMSERARRKLQLDRERGAA